MIKCQGLIFVCAVFITLSTSKFAFSLNVECGFENAYYWNVFGGRPYGCIIANIQGTKNLKENITITNYNESASYDAVKVIEIRSGFSNYVPTGFDKYFDNVEGFSMYKTEVVELSSDELKQFPKLREFWIYFNLLEYLPANLFEHNPALEFIGFEHNKIKVIEPEIFDYIPKLFGFQLRGNKCIDRYVSEKRLIKLFKREITKKCSVIKPPSKKDEWMLQIDALNLKISQLDNELEHLEESKKKNP